MFEADRFKTLIEEFDSRNTEYKIARKLVLRGLHYGTDTFLKVEPHIALANKCNSGDDYNV